MHQTVLGKFLIFQCLKLRNPAESTHRKLRSQDSWASTSYLSQAPHQCQSEILSWVWKFPLLTWKRTYFSSLGIFLLLFLGKYLGEKLCGPHSVARCKTNEKYDVCSSEGAIRRVRLQSHLLIWFLIFPKYPPSITSYCIVLYCIVLLISPGTDSSLSRQSSLIFFTSTTDSNVSDNHTLHLKSHEEKCEQLNMEKANLEKTKVWVFRRQRALIGEKKTWKLFY